MCCRFTEPVKSLNLTEIQISKVFPFFFWVFINQRFSLKKCLKSQFQKYFSLACHKLFHLLIYSFAVLSFHLCKRYKCIYLFGHYYCKNCSASSRLQICAPFSAVWKWRRDCPQSLDSLENFSYKLYYFFLTWMQLPPKLWLNAANLWCFCS